MRCSRTLRRARSRSSSRCRWACDDGRRAGSGAAAPTRWQAIAARIDAYERLIRLDKPIGTLLLLWPTLSALWLAAFGSPSWIVVGIFALGTLLMRSAGCAINDYADRNFDAHVERTANRPLARGEIAPWEALAVAAALACCALLLVLPLNRTTILLSVPALLITVAYPLLQAVFRAAAGFPRHRVLVRHSDGVRVGLWRGDAARMGAVRDQPVLGDGLRHRVRDGRPRRRPEARAAERRRSRSAGSTCWS